MLRVLLLICAVAWSGCLGIGAVQEGPPGASSFDGIYLEDRLSAERSQLQQEFTAPPHERVVMTLRIVTELPTDEVQWSVYTDGRLVEQGTLTGGTERAAVGSWPLTLGNGGDHRVQLNYGFRAAGALPMGSVTFELELAPS